MAGSANTVQVNLGMNAVTFTAGIKAAQAELDKFSGKAKQAGHSTVSQMQAASASIREMNGDFTRNTRAVERFITTIPGVGKVLQAAFPLIGGLAFGAMLVSAGEKAAAFIKTANNMPKAITQGFASLNLASKTSVDQLQLTNDTLQNSINKLEHKPVNNIAIAMDEARLAADKLAESIEKSNGALNELLSKNHLSGWSLLMGKQGTADREGTNKAFGVQSDNDAYSLANATTPAQTAAAQKAIQDTENARLAEARQDLAARQTGAKQADYTGGNLDESANIAIDKGTITAILNQQKEAAAEILNAKLEAQNKSLEASKAAAEQAKQAAALRLQGMVATLEAEKLQGNVSLKQVYDYWDARRSAFTAGSAAYNEVITKQAQAAFEAASKAHEQITKAIADIKRGSTEDSTTGIDALNRGARGTRSEQIASGNEQSQGYVDSNQQAIDQAANTAKDQEAQLTDEAGKSMSRYAAVVQLANVHTQQFITTQVALQGILDTRIAQQKANPTAETDRAVSEAQIAMANAQSGRGIQIASDAQNVSPAATSPFVGATDALDEFVNASKDAAAQMREFTTSTINGFNDVLLKIMTTRTTGYENHMAFANYGAGLFRGVAQTGLQKAEGSALSAVGFGGSAKLGTQANPMWTRSVGVGGSVGSAVSSAGGFLKGLFGGGSKGPGQDGLNAAMDFSTGAAADDAAAGGLSTVDSAITDLLPAFANGGQIDGPALIGERGPEVWTPPVAGGTVIPNNKLNIGGSTGHTINIDATGSTDPAATQAAVMRGIQAAAPHISANTLNAQRDQQRRKPTSARTR